MWSVGRGTRDEGENESSNLTSQMESDQLAAAAASQLSQSGRLHVHTHTQTDKQTNKINNSHESRPHLQAASQLQLFEMNESLCSAACYEERELAAIGD